MSQSDKKVRRPRFTSRTRARKRALDILFEADQRSYGYNTQRILALLDRRKTERAAQSELPAYAVQIVAGVCKHIREIDDLVAQYSTSWKLERMPGVDLCLARIAIWEILYSGDVEPGVAIEQAANIAAVVSTDKSPDFLTGLLNRIAELKPSLVAAQAEAEEAEEASDSEVSAESNREADAVIEPELYDDDLDDIWLADLPEDVAYDLSEEDQQ